VSLREPRAFRLQVAALLLQAGERAVGIRDGALRFTQRIARFSACRFLLVELGL
jgi:hypothetical protein